MLHSNEIKSHVSVESNKQAFLKCLIVKNILQMDKVEFKYGDFVSYLESTAELFDFIIASGVLYHLKNPIKGVLAFGLFPLFSFVKQRYVIQLVVLIK